MTLLEGQPQRHRMTDQAANQVCLRQYVDASGQSLVISSLDASRNEIFLLIQRTFVYQPHTHNELPKHAAAAP